MTYYLLLIRVYRDGFIIYYFRFKAVSAAGIESSKHLIKLKAHHLYANQHALYSHNNQVSYNDARNAIPAVGGFCQQKYDHHHARVGYGESSYAQE